jgi:hypothetical protein
MKKIKLAESDNGVIFRIDKIPNTMFNFCIIKRREFKDGTCRWSICTGLAADTKKYMVIDTMRGTKTDATKRLEEIIKES